jgi:phenylalanyl-tRNA synthetase beta chain
MQISLRWINELVNVETVDIEDLINKLTLGGFEVEEVLEIELSNLKTTAFEISATANRSDSLSIQGLSLEIAALLNSMPKKLNYSTKNYLWSEQFEKFQSNHGIQNECSGFVALIIENLSNFTSPEWLQQKLISCGLPVNNNLNDFQNYILIETGYPLEFYDFDKIYLKSNKPQVQLSLTPVNNSLDFSATNGNKYSLNESTLILKANDLPISIAGIISSKETNYSSNTQTLLVEASIFNAAKIRQQSRMLGLRTDRSSRYEKSIKNTTLLESIYRFISLLRIANPKLICKLHTVDQLTNEPVKKIELTYERVKQVLGPIKKTTNIQKDYISPQVITNALERLQFKIDYDSLNFKWNIIIPSLRSDDIVREIDVIEEIGRIYGFNNFLTRLPNIKNIGQEDFDYQIRKKLTSCLINLGLNELIQYSLVTNETYLKNDIKLINPLVKDYSNLRSTLLPNLIKAVEENVKKGNSILEGFEYGHAFSLNSSLSINEIELIAGIFGGVKTKSEWSASFNKLSWFGAKGRIETIFKKLNIITYWKSYKPIKEKNIFHLYCTAEIFLSNGNKVGVFGQISPILANKLNISTDIYLFEFNFDVIKNRIQQNKLSVYQEYSLYPKIIKDLSFIVKDNISFSKIKELLHLNGSHFLKEISLLDEYRGKSIPVEHTSLCLQLVFQSNFETLQTEKVETIVNNLRNLLMKKFKVTIRI